MVNHPNSQNSGQPWWHRESKDTLDNRIRRIQSINDPTTYADEVLKAAKILLILLLAFSGMLGGLSYIKAFEVSFGIEAAVAMALCLTIAIEWGKNYATTRALRIPFFHGSSYITSTPSGTFIFLGLVAVAIATFSMSVYNSTKGSQQLSMMLSHEKNDVAFSPDTKAIDDQLATLSGSVAAAPMVKWKGKSYYQDAKSVRAANKSIESLQRQREQTVQMQRSDYERTLSVKSSQSSFTGRLVLASGGWIELLQVLLIILRVACERSLYRGNFPTPSFQASKNGAHHGATQPIGFNIDNDGNVRRNQDNRGPVPQTPPAVPQVNAAMVLSSDEALRWFESELKKEPANFQNKHANEETVANRISLKLIRAERYLVATPDRSIPAESADRFGNYLTQSLFPLLEERNYQPNYEIITILDAKKDRV